MVGAGRQEVKKMNEIESIRAEIEKIAEYIAQRVRDGASGRGLEEDATRLSEKIDELRSAEIKRDMQ